MKAAAAVATTLWFGLFLPLVSTEHWFLMDRTCRFRDVSFEPFKLQSVYEGCMQCVCWKHDTYEVLLCRMLCPRWLQIAGPHLSISEDGALH